MRKSLVTTDPYRVLGLSDGATALEVKQAFRARVKEVHPDVNPGTASLDRFLAVTDAYHVLRDPARRRAVDARRANHRMRRQARRKAWLGRTFKAAAVGFGVIVTTLALQATLPEVPSGNGVGDAMAEAAPLVATLSSRPALAKRTVPASPQARSPAAHLPEPEPEPEPAAQIATIASPAQSAAPVADNGPLVHANVGTGTSATPSPRHVRKRPTLSRPTSRDARMPKARASRAGHRFRYVQLHLQT